MTISRIVIFALLTLLTYRTKHTVNYINLSSTVQPITPSDQLPVLNLASPFTLNEQERELTNFQLNGDLQLVQQIDHDSLFEAGGFSSESHLISPGELNDVIRDLNIAKTQGELLAYRLKGWNLFEKDARLTSENVT